MLLYGKPTVTNNLHMKEDALSVDQKTCGGLGLCFDMSNYFQIKSKQFFSFKKCININIMVAQKPCPRRMALTWMVIGTTVLVFVTATLLTVLLTGRWLSIWFIINLIFSELGPGFLSSCISLHPCKTTLILRTEAYSPSVLGHFSKAAVAVDGKPCAQIAKWELWTWW